uniref:Putative secreted protein n=1 Tax=Anopheles darlingi TaxID=43151 RepID=A0A2M4D5Z2_ANODA
MVTLGVGCCLLPPTDGEPEPRVIEMESLPIRRLAPCGEEPELPADDDEPPPPPEDDLCCFDEEPPPNELIAPPLPAPSPASIPRLAS